LLLLIIHLYNAAEKSEDSPFITRHKPLKLITPCWLYTYTFKYIIHMIVVNIYHVDLRQSETSKIYNHKHIIRRILYFYYVQ